MKKEKKNFQRPAFRFKRFARKSYSAFASMGKIVSIGVMTGVTLITMGESAIAQDSLKNEKIIEKELDEVSVTASQTEVPLEEVSKSVVVVTKQEIEQAPIQSLNDLLSYIASVDNIQRGGHGVQTDISIRGGSLDQVAILINGINLSNAQTGHLALDIPINLSDIERIEILHGPSALIYGSSAFSGGINIITKKENSDRVFAQVGAGMHNLKSIETRASTSIKSTINSLSASYKSSDGYINNSDYEIYNALWQTRLKLSGKNKIDFQLGYNNKKFGANTFYSAAYPEQYEETSSYLGTIKGQFGDKLKVTPILYWNRHHDQFDLVRNTDFGQNFHRNDTYGGNLILSYQYKLGTSSISSEIRKDEIMSTKLGIPMKVAHRKYTHYDARTNFSMGLEHQLKLEKWNVSAGMLISSNSMDYDKYYFLPSASISFLPSKGLKIHSSWSKSIRVPTFTDLYYTTETHTANEQLHTEQSEAWELGLKYSNNILSTYITGYLSWGHNLIDWIKENPNDKTWKSWNHSKVNTRGIELGAKLNLSKNSYLKLDYSLIDQDMDSKGMISKYSLNYLKNKMTAQLNHPICKNLSVSWFFRLQDRAGSYIKYENLKAGESVKYPIFSTLDISLSYTYEHFNINLDLNNLYNTKYYDLGNIPQAGFWLIGGISYTLK